MREAVVVMQSKHDFGATTDWMPTEDTSAHLFGLVEEKKSRIFVCLLLALILDSESSILSWGRIRLNSVGVAYISSLRDRHFILEDSSKSGVTMPEENEENFLFKPRWYISLSGLKLAAGNKGLKLLAIAEKLLDVSDASSPAYVVLSAENIKMRRKAG
jgi:hypothetical protein